MSDNTAAGDDDDWILEDDESAAEVTGYVPRAPWRILVVDDEPDIHAVTRMALANVVFKDRAVELLSAHSGKEGYEILSRESDIALVLLDVVMESDDAGLVLARRIREELKNTMVRIVLRTGQPGQAPEDRVIVEYDINDYKAKTELTKQKLFTTLISSLRGYEGLLTIDRSRVGLDKILHCVTDLYQLRSLQGFSSGVLRQISAIIDVGTNGVLCVMQDNREEKSTARIIAATGEYAELAEKAMLPTDHPWSSQVNLALSERRNVFAHPVDVLFIEAAPGREFVIVLTPPYPLSDFQCSLLSLFCERIAIAFDNLAKHEELLAVCATYRSSANEAMGLLAAKEGSELDPDTLARVQQVLGV